MDIERAERDERTLGRVEALLLLASSLVLAFTRRLGQVRLLTLFLLVCSIATGGMLPVWAQLAEVEGSHVCHCSSEHHGCVCPRCGTDPDARADRSMESIKGRCGDDDRVFGGRGFVAVLPSLLPTVPSANDEPRGESRVVPLRALLRIAPPTPPPRSG